MITIHCSECHGVAIKELDVRGASDIRMLMRCDHCKKPLTIEVRVHTVEIRVNGNRLEKETGRPNIRTL